MAAAVSIPLLAPRPSPRALAAAWTPHTRHFMDGKENQQQSLKSSQQRPLQDQQSQAKQQLSAPLARAKRERPCDGCRRRKSKCVLQESRRCVLCEFHKQDCTFVENAQPRKRKAEETSPRSDGAVKRNPTATKNRSPVTKTATISVSAPSLPTTVPNTATVARQPPVLPRMTSQDQSRIVDDSLSLQAHRHCKYLGQTTALDTALIGLGVFNDKNETASSMGTLRQVTGTEYFSTHADSDIAVPADEARALADIDDVVRPHGPALIDIYFRVVHPSYPIIQKQAFLDRLSHGDRQFNPPLLAAMYLLALGWWELEPSVSSYAMPDVARLEYLASTSLTIAMQRPKISAVQAGLLLLQRAKSSTWALTVQLVALGQDTGLHLDCSDWSIPVWERRLRKRLAWALYMQDKWSAVMHGRPSHISAADWNVPVPTEEDFDENLQPLPTPNEDVDGPIALGRTCFMQMISLTSIMAEVCEVFYSESAKAEYARAGRYATQLVLNRAKPVQIKLKDWFARLPADCKMENSGSISGPSTFGSGELFGQGYLHLAYFATEISIHRRIVQSLDPSAGAATTDSAAPSDPSAAPYLLFICRSAAKTRLISALDFVNRLRPEHLHAFWYFASTFNFALIGTFGALLQATSPGREEAWFYACRLNEYRWTLSVSAKKASWIQGALDLLDANGELLRGLPEKPSAAEAMPLPPPMPMPMSSVNYVTVPHDLMDEDEDEFDEEDCDDEEGDEADAGSL